MPSLKDAVPLRRHLKYLLFVSPWRPFKHYIHRWRNARNNMFKKRLDSLCCGCHAYKIISTRCNYILCSLLGFFKHRNICSDLYWANNMFNSENANQHSVSVAGNYSFCFGISYLAVSDADSFCSLLRQ